MWMRAQNQWRVPTRNLLIRPDKANRTYKDGFGGEHVVLQGHTGAVWHPRVNEDKTINRFFDSQAQTLGTGTMHNLLFAAFENPNQNVSTLRIKVIKIKEAFMWNGVEPGLPPNASDLHQSGEGGPHIDADKLRDNAAKGAELFEKDVIDNNLKSDEAPSASE